MKFSYRTRRRFRRFCTGLLYLFLIFLLVYGIWVLWGQRYIIFTREGVRLDFSLPPMEPGQVVQAPEPSPTVEIEEQIPQVVEQVPGMLSQVVGYYIDTDMLIQGIEPVREAIEQLPAGTAVMLDLKSKFGYFYYSTRIAEASASTSMDISGMDSLIAALSRSDLYTIARIPAFRDRAYGLMNQSAGLAVSSGALWEDPEACYWLNPANEDTMNYLQSIVEELQALGFHEVVFTDFQLPEAESIVYDPAVSSEALIQEAAATLVEQCARGNFTVSFQSDDPAFVIPEGRSRLYLSGIAADQVAETAAAVSVEDPIVNLVFLSEVNDTRYNDYGVLRPLPITPQT